MVIFGRREMLDELWWIVQASRLDIFSLHSFRSWNVFEPVRLFYLSCCEYTHTQNTFDAVCLSKNNSCYWFRRRTEIVLRIANWMEGFSFWLVIMNLARKSHMSFASAGLCAKAIEAMAASQPLKKLSVIYSVDIIFFSLIYIMLEWRFHLRQN